jgi:hypothetical protein
VGRREWSSEENAARRREIASMGGRARWGNQPPPPVVIGDRGQPVGRARQRQIRLRDAGRCISCGKLRGEDSRAKCADCRYRERKGRERRARREAGKAGP